MLKSSKPANNNNRTTKKITLKTETAASLGIAAVFSVLLLTFLVTFSPVPAPLCGVIALIVLAALCILLYIVLERRARGDVPDELKPVMAPMMFETLENSEAPAFICDAREKVLWFNAATEKLFGTEKIYGKKVRELFSSSLADLYNAADGEKVRFAYKDRSFRLSCNRRIDENGEYTLVITTERTAYDNLTKKLDDGELAVGYVVIDNLNEMLQYDAEHYRPAAAKVDRILSGWAEEHGALLKEYENDKYLLITNRGTAAKMLDERFDVLDRVRSVRVGETNLPLTVSMGVATIGGTYDEKEKAAHAALDMALQRGGDQVVLKTDDMTECIGGVMKTAQKRTSAQSAVAANKLMNEINSASNVIVMGHRHADFDAFGACVGLAKIAISCGARVNIVIDTADRNLIGCRDIIAEDEDYLGLFVTAPEALDMLETGTLVIMCDVNNPDITEEPELAKRAEKLAVIDHHRVMSDYNLEPVVNFIDPSASSTCELVSEMLEQVLPKDELSAAEANVILAGIALDTKQFTKNTGTRTFSVAMYLRDRGADPMRINSLFRESFEDYRREAFFRQNVEIYKNVYAFTTVGNDGEEGALDRTIAAKAADNLLRVDGIKASFALIVEGDTVHVSARSAGEINVELVMKELGGGGHFDTAAVQLASKTVDEVVADIKTAIAKVENEK